MTAIDQTYRCNMCGNVVKVIEAGEGELVCCGEPMVLSMDTPGTAEEIGEKEETQAQMEAGEMKIEPEMGPEADMENEIEPKTEMETGMGTGMGMGSAMTEEAEPITEEEPDSEIKIKGSEE